jgi:hypothetical protein
MRRRLALSAAGSLAVAVVLAAFWYRLSRAPVPSAQPPASAGRSATEQAAPRVLPRLGPLVSAEPAVPATGTGRFTIAAGAGPQAGRTGALIRYQVLVEIGSGVPADGFAAIVDATLADPRGWTAGGRWSFQRVPAGPADVQVHLATPATTDLICARHAVRTAGEVSCRGGRDIVVNLRRWLLGVPWYTGALDDYRRMVVNHEVGHFLGHGHARCPAAGSLAPVMQTQTYGLAGCTRNPWPYPDGHTYVTGPAAPP